MSKNYESKNYSKKKFYGNSRTESGSSGGGYNATSRNKDPEAFSVKQPTILIKAREKPSEDVAEPAKKIIMQNEAHAATNPTVQTPVPHTAPETNTSNSPRVMHRSVKFLEDSTICFETLQEFLGENNDFLVVGVTGAQGTGKSTILNLLAHAQLTDIIKNNIFYQISTNDKNVDATFGDRSMADLQIDEKKVKKKLNIFRIQSNEDVGANRHCTTGIDMYITENRVIFLDCQPFLSVTVLDDLMKSDTKRSSIISDYLWTENSGEIQSLQLMTFLMSVCHVVMFVQESFFDTNMIRFLKTAEMLKPTVPSPDDEFLEHFPHLILVHNKAEMDYFLPSKFKLIQQLYRSMFNDTRLHIESNLGIGGGTIIQNLSPETCGDPLNIYMLPDYSEDAEKYYNGHPPLDVLIQSFRSSLLGATKYALTHVPLTEKNWLVYSGKVWDHVKKSSFFVEYTKLLS